MSWDPALVAKNNIPSDSAVSSITKTEEKKGPDLASSLTILVKQNEGEATRVEDEKLHPEKLLEMKDRIKPSNPGTEDFTVEFEKVPHGSSPSFPPSKLTFPHSSASSSSVSTSPVILPKPPLIPSSPSASSLSASAAPDETIQEQLFKKLKQCDGLLQRDLAGKIDPSRIYIKSKLEKDAAGNLDLKLEDPADPSKKDVYKIKCTYTIQVKDTHDKVIEQKLDAYIYVRAPTIEGAVSAVQDGKDLFSTIALEAFKVDGIVLKPSKDEAINRLAISAFNVGFERDPTSRVLRAMEFSPLTEVTTGGASATKKYQSSSLKFSFENKKDKKSYLVENDKIVKPASEGVRELMLNEQNFNKFYITRGEKIRRRLKNLKPEKIDLKSLKNQNFAVEEYISTLQEDIKVLHERFEQTWNANFKKDFFGRLSPNYTQLIKDSRYLQTLQDKLNQVGASSLDEPTLDLNRVLGQLDKKGVSKEAQKIAEDFITNISTTQAMNTLKGVISDLELVKNKSKEARTEEEKTAIKNLKGTHGAKTLNSLITLLKEKEASHTESLNQQLEDSHSYKNKLLNEQQKLIKTEKDLQRLRESLHDKLADLQSLQQDMQTHLSNPISDAERTEYLAHLNSLNELEKMTSKILASQKGLDVISEEIKSVLDVKRDAEAV